MVRQNILDLQRELQQLKKTNSDQQDHQQSAADPPSDPGIVRSTTGGALTDRFTNEAVVLNAPAKVKAGGGSELQVTLGFYCALFWRFIAAHKAPVGCVFF